VVDFGATEEEGDACVPVSLFSSAKDHDIVYVCSFLEKDCRGQGRAERCYFGGVDEGAGCAIIF
jgi:hypothetical protein